jgi:hypothetical protein
MIQAIVQANSGAISIITIPKVSPFILSPMHTRKTTSASAVAQQQGGNDEIAAMMRSSPVVDRRHSA